MDLGASGCPKSHGGVKSALQRVQLFELMNSFGLHLLLTFREELQLQSMAGLRGEMLLHGSVCHHSLTAPGFYFWKFLFFLFWKFSFLLEEILLWRETKCS